MPLFRYQAFDPTGKIFSGELDVSGERELRENLRSKGIRVFKVSRADQSSTLTGFLLSIISGSVDQKTKIQFTQQLSVLLKSGVPLLACFDLLVDQYEGKIKSILSGIRDDLREGKNLADSLERYPRVFSNVYVQLVRAGEASGNLEVVLDRMATFLERSEETSKKIKKAMIGPVFQVVIIILVVAGSTTFVIPSMAGILQATGKELPDITKFMIGISDFFTNNYIFAGISLFLFIGIFSLWKSSKSGRLQYHSLLLRLPKVSTFVRNRAVVQFSQTLGMLLEAGVNLSSALDIVSNIVDNEILRSTLKEARENIIKEGKIAQHLESTKIFPPVSNYMIKTGEESGQLSQMLVKVGSDSETELIESTDQLTAAISPIMNILIALVVLVIVLSIFLPIMEISNIEVAV